MRLVVMHLGLAGKAMRPAEITLNGWDCPEACWEGPEIDSEDHATS